MQNHIDQGCSFLVLKIYQRDSFPALPALLTADYLNQVCPFSQNVETSDRADQQVWRSGEHSGW